MTSNLFANFQLPKITNVIADYRRGRSSSSGKLLPSLGSAGSEKKNSATELLPDGAVGGMDSNRKDPNLSDFEEDDDVISEFKKTGRPTTAGTTVAKNAYQNSVCANLDNLSFKGKRPTGEPEPEPTPPAVKEVLETVVKDKEKANMNDRIIQEKLEEAKAMNRVNDDGAIMYKFSLWGGGGGSNSSNNNVDNKPMQPTPFSPITNGGFSFNNNNNNATSPFNIRRSGDSPGDSDSNNNNNNSGALTSSGQSLCNRSSSGKQSPRLSKIPVSSRHRAHDFEEVPEEVHTPTSATANGNANVNGPSTLMTMPSPLKSKILVNSSPTNGGLKSPTKAHNKKSFSPVKKTPVGAMSPLKDRQFNRGFPSATTTTTTTTTTAIPSVNSRNAKNNFRGDSGGVIAMDEGHSGRNTPNAHFNADSLANKNSKSRINNNNNGSRIKSKPSSKPNKNTQPDKEFKSNDLDNNNNNNNNNDEEYTSVSEEDGCDGGDDVSGCSSSCSRGGNRNGAVLSEMCVLGVSLTSSGDMSVFAPELSKRLNNGNGNGNGNINNSSSGGESSNRNSHSNLYSSHVSSDADEYYPAHNNSNNNNNNSGNDDDAKKNFDTLRGISRLPVSSHNYKKEYDNNENLQQRGKNSCLQVVDTETASSSSLPITGFNSPTKSINSSRNSRSNGSSSLSQVQQQQQHQQQPTLLIPLYDAHVDAVKGNARSPRERLKARSLLKNLTLPSSGTTTGTLTSSNGTNILSLSFDKQQQRLSAIEPLTAMPGKIPPILNNDSLYSNNNNSNNNSNITAVMRAYSANDAIESSTFNDNNSNSNNLAKVSKSKLEYIHKHGNGTTTTTTTTTTRPRPPRSSPADFKDDNFESKTPNTIARVKLESLNHKNGNNLKELFADSPSLLMLNPANIPPSTSLTSSRKSDRGGNERGISNGSNKSNSNSAKGIAGGVAFVGTTTTQATPGNLSDKNLAYESDESNNSSDSMKKQKSLRGITTLSNKNGSNGGNNGATTSTRGFAFRSSSASPLDTELEAASTLSLPEQQEQIRWKRGVLIGEGSFGKVYKGLNERTGELLAIKQLYLSDTNESDVEMIQEEISVICPLDHENIVKYLGTSKSDRHLFILLEYVPGGSIAGMLSQYGAFSEDLTRRLSYQILVGVEYLHSKGIIHRDIKGSNVLVTDAGVAKLSDFGCSKQLSDLCTMSVEDSAKAIKGSVPWMAPEVIKQSGYGRSSDIWSFGATIIEMAVGKPPWSEFTNNLAALFHVANSESPPPFPEKLSDIANSFLAKCLVVDPKGRLTAKELLTDAFFIPEIQKIKRLSSRAASK